MSDRNARSRRLRGTLRGALAVVVAIALGVAAPAALARGADPGPRSEAPPATEARLRLGTTRVHLPRGPAAVVVELEPGSVASFAVFGPADALLAFDVLAPASLAEVAERHRPLDEDGVLPHVVSLRVPSDVTEALVLVEGAAPLVLARVSAALPPPLPPGWVAPRHVDPAGAPPWPPGWPTPRELANDPSLARVLVGVPMPSSRDDGYLLQSPGRYQFARADVAAALLAALRQTRVRFRRDPIAIGDISQWDGVRPATDLGRPRHISHAGGRDVDLALPSNDDEPSTFRAHCSGTLVEADVQRCAPGTIKGVDSLRLAYLLGLLIDGPPAGRVEKIFTDDVYAREIRRAADKLRERRWIKDRAYAALTDEGLVHASPWHVDHVHVRFAGEGARVPW